MTKYLHKYSKKSSIRILSKGNFKRSSGRSNSGKILIRYRGAGAKRRYRIIDFYRGIWNIPAVVVGVEYTSYWFSPVACLSYFVGILSYIKLVEGLRVGSTILSGILHVPIRSGNSSVLIMMPINRHLSTVGLAPNRVAIFSRAACAYSKIVKKKKFVFYIMLKSGCIKKVSPFAAATYGIVYKPSFILNNKLLANAGRSRRLGYRPKVRGVAMNPIDHPHGGGEGKKSAKAAPRNLWGFMFKNKRTARH